MADSSFYGGQPGTSFIIVANYATVDEMIQNFQNGPSYEAVHFDEHVLINTEDKKDKDNGKIYRRGYDYTNDMGGAIYVGTIVGPAGYAPLVELTTVAEVESIQEQQGYEYRYSSGSYAPTENFVAGKDDDGNFTDEIRWACCSVRDENGEDTIAYIGFIIPYLVIDVEGQSVSAYYNRVSTTSGVYNTDLVKRADDQTHPFYQKWSISVPKGIKGDTFGSMQVIGAADWYAHEDLTYDGFEDDIEKNRQVITYNLVSYDNGAAGEIYPSEYLADYNMIENISIDDEGTVIISYTHDDDSVYDKKFKWIKEIELNSDTGEFTVTYNQEFDADGMGTQYVTYLNWINNVQMTADGSIIFTKVDGTTISFDKVIKSISSVDIQTAAGSSGEEGTGDQKVHITYSTGEEVAIGEPLNYVMDMALTDDYKLLVRYSDPEKRLDLKGEGKTEYYDGDGNGYDDWYNLGTVKDYNGILIGTWFQEWIVSDISQEYPTIIDVLNDRYPDGLEGDNITGKVIVVGGGDQNKYYFGYDYEGRQWFYLGTLTNAAYNTYMFAYDDGSFETLEKQDQLDLGGMWFVLEDD